MSAKAAQRRRGLTCPPAQELLLHNAAAAALEGVDNCSTLLLQELLQHKHPSLLHVASPTPAATRAAAIDKQGLFHLGQVPPLQQATDTHNLHSRSCDSLLSRAHLEHAELQPHPNDQLSAPESSASLLNQCSALSSSGLMCSGEWLDHLAINSKGMTLPALCFEPLPSRKAPVAAPKRAQRASLRRAAKKSSTVGTKFSPSENGIIDSPCNGRKTTTCGPANHFLTERQRREFLNEKYQVLRSLIPNPTKADRASIVQDAINHVNELKEHVEKLQLDKRSRDSKRRKAVDDGIGDKSGRGEARSCETEQHPSTRGKGCHAQMTSKYGTGIDVRVMDDEATIEVTHHRSQDNCLLVAVLMLHEADLELLHANGARIGNHHVYMLHVKGCC